jgi:hypothetical protein
MRKSHSGSGHKGNQQGAQKSGAEMAVTAQRHEGLPSDLEEGEAELLEGWGVYLENRFPNPDRIGCPGTAVLKEMATDPKNFHDRQAIDHISRCSPCSDELRTLLRAARSPG